MFGIFFLMLCFMLSLVNAILTYTPSSDTSCNNGSCTKTLYSGIRNVYEDGRWKRVENARSLMNKGFEVVYLEDDGIHKIEVIDFNYTSITVELRMIDSKKLNENVPVKIWQINQTKEIDYNNNIAISKEQSKSIEERYKETYDNIFQETKKFYSISEQSIKTYDFGPGKIMEFGFNSTTIMLQDADTENTDDVSTYVAGAGTAHCCGNIFIKFNITSIPTGNQIDSVDIYFYVFNNVGWGNTTTYGRINNQTWTEIQGSSLGTLNTTNHTTDGSFGNTTGWDNLNVTNQFLGDYNYGNSNFSIAMEEGTGLSPLSNGENGSLQYLILGYRGENPWHEMYAYSKEYSDVSLRPYLNITYTETTPPDTTPPTFDNLANKTQNANNSFSFDLDASDDVAIDSFTLNSTAKYIINISTGVITNSTNLTEPSITWLNVTVNDTSNNLHSDIFYIQIQAPAPAASTGTGTPCRYKKFGYYNLNLPAMWETGCL